MAEESKPKKAEKKGKVAFKPEEIPTAKNKEARKAKEKEWLKAHLDKRETRRKK